jgi:hypothetical protein
MFVVAPLLQFDPNDPSARLKSSRILVDERSTELLARNELALLVPRAAAKA